jgi:hydroxymethyl cephem carbamoyltransferase
MALISFADLSKLDKSLIEKYKNSIKLMIRQFVIKRKTSEQVQFVLNELNHIGILPLKVTDQLFCDFAKLFSDMIIEHIITEIRPYVKQNIPLLISGGCGLNCDWNTALRETKLFSDVFVAPCTDDSGSSIGTAIEAQYRITGSAKIKWDVYAGEAPFYDNIDENSITKRDYNSKLIAKLLFDGEIIPVVQGRAEIGPRALGNRSILASPLNADIKNKLNTIKQRESYRPVAPMVLQEDASLHFDVPTGYESPYMLFFEKLKTDKLPGVTHIDNSARIQTVTKTQNEKIYFLLKDFKELSGYGVLCNTSLNFNGRGFINTLSDLFNFCKTNNLKWFVFGDFLYEVKYDS